MTLVLMPKMKNPHRLKYDQLIAYIRKYDASSLIRMIINYGSIISQYDIGSKAYINNLRKSPSHYELDSLCIWVHRYGQSGNKIIDEDCFIKLCRKFRKSRNGIELYIEKQVQQTSVSRDEGILFRTLRRAAFLQFRYQNQQPYEDLARQYIMFVKLDKEGVLSKKFSKLSTISIKEFLYTYLILLLLIEQYGDIEIPYIEKSEILQKILTFNTFNGFFTLLSKGINSAKDFIKNYEGKFSHTDINFRLFEQTPFERYPFFKFKDYYAYYHKRLLYAAIENNLYDICKEVDPNMCGEFSKVTSEGGFGQIFEGYVHKALEYYTSDKKEELIIYNTQNIREKLLLNKKDSCVDFLVIEDNTGVLIECKSTEYHKKSRIIQNKESRTTALKVQIIKAVQQIIHTIDKLLDKKPVVIDKVKTLYGIVITYKQYYLGSGESLYNEMSELLPIEPKISAKNLFFLSISEFDYLIAAARANNTTLSKILSGLTDSDHNNSLMFSMGLDKICNNTTYRAQYLTDALEEMHANAIKHD
ncbi:hypothetical protein Trichorick_01695 (plasmid) [Candidatus Trichorickettsia mobilis]|uniref:hypothetical protein n=1 Tax=Candidatus Trichorickettsia mobilis TaxID=1346319 RepID=UPI002B25E360|nr:hypothetical protein [Candidatus Trichorickettsia mobilis]WPY01777.1 hypothetical protein Trichorick_01695 [Candidatus Trichorickettsia mobilis]